MDYKPPKFYRGKYTNGTLVGFIGNDSKFHTGTIVQTEHINIIEGRALDLLVRYSIIDDDTGKRHKVYERFTCRKEHFDKFKQAIQAELDRKNQTFPTRDVDQWRMVFDWDFDNDRPLE